MFAAADFGNVLNSITLRCKPVIVSDNQTHRF